MYLRCLITLQNFFQLYFEDEERTEMYELNPEHTLLQVLQHERWGCSCPVQVQREHKGKKNELYVFAFKCSLFSDLIVLTLEGVKQWDHVDFVPGFSDLHFFFPQKKLTAFSRTRWRWEGELGYTQAAAQKGCFRSQLHSTTLKKKKKRQQHIKRACWRLTMLSLLIMLREQPPTQHAAQFDSETGFKVLCSYLERRICCLWSQKVIVKPVLLTCTIL